MTSLVLKPFSVDEEYKKHKDITAEDIAKLRQWLQTQPHLPREHITDQDLILIYHRYERSIEVSKQNVDQQYTLRTLFTSFFKDRQVDDIAHVFDILIMQILPTRSNDGYAVMYGCMLDNDSGKFDFGATIKAMVMILDLWQYAEGTWPGFMFLFDMGNVNVGVLSKLDWQNIQQFIAYFPDALLVKLKGVHFINAPYFMDRINALMKTFMSKQFFDLVVVHQAGSKSLERVIDPAALPKEAGGESKSVQEFREETLAKMKANSEFFANENKKRVVESLRPGKPKTITDIFGSVEGSFKQLEID